LRLKNIKNGALFRCVVLTSLSNQKKVKIAYFLSIDVVKITKTKIFWNSGIFKFRTMMNAFAEFGKPV